MDDSTKKAYSIEVFEEGIMYYQFFEDDFKYAEKRALEFVQKGMSFSAWIHDREDVVEIVKWDEDL